MLEFKEENLLSLNFLTEKLEFPICVATYSEWENEQLIYMIKNYKSNKFTTENICHWCINHNIQYQIMYPLRKKELLINPIKYYRYIKLRKRLDIKRGSNN